MIFTADNHVKIHTFVNTVWVYKWVCGIAFFRAVAIPEERYVDIRACLYLRHRDTSTGLPLEQKKRIIQLSRQHL